MDKVDDAATVAKEPAVKIFKQSSDQLRRGAEIAFKASEAMQVAGSGVQAYAQVGIGDMQMKMAELQRSMALTNANMAIFYSVNELQNNVAQQVTEHYSQAVQGLDRSFSTAQRQMAEGMKTLADVLGGQSA